MFNKNLIKIFFKICSTMCIEVKSGLAFVKGLSFLRGIALIKVNYGLAFVKGLLNRKPSYMMSGLIAPFNYLHVGYFRDEEKEVVLEATVFVLKCIQQNMPWTEIIEKAEKLGWFIDPIAIQILTDLATKSATQTIPETIVNTGVQAITEWIYNTIISTLVNNAAEVIPSALPDNTEALIYLGGVFVVYLVLAKLRNRYFPHLEPKPAEIPSNSSSDSQEYYSVMEDSSNIDLFLMNHSTILIATLTLTSIGIILYLFKPFKQKVSTPLEAINKSKLLFGSTLKYIITLYASWILFVRSFFIKERPWIVPLLIVITHTNLYLKIFPTYDITSITYFFLWVGIYLIGIDGIGSLISSYALNGTSNLFDQVIPFLNDDRKNRVTDFYKSAGFHALIIGRTAMTATGRAALGVGVISGTGYLVNAHLERTYKTAENIKNRDFTASEAQRQRDFTASETQRQRDFAAHEAQKQRDWQDKKDQRQVYDSSWNPFRKPPKD